MRPRSLLAIWLSLLLVLASAPAAPVGGAQDSGGIDAIRAEYNNLLNLFYRPLDPGDLLQAGWSALGNDAPRRGAAAPGPLPELPADPDEAFNLFANAYLNYLASVPASFTPAQAAADVGNGMADSLREQHTHYLPPAIWRAFLSTVGGGQEMVGTGVRLGSDPAGLIKEVAPGGPAATAGIQAGDVITNVDGRDLAGADTPSMAAALVGPGGSSVTITVDRGDGSHTFVVTRGPFYFPPLETSLLPGAVGYVRLSDFVIAGRTLPNGTELLADLDNRLDDLDAQGAQSLILDLRDNGGGSVQTADEILGRFLPDTVRSIHESDERGHESYDIASGRIHARQLPMAVMINGGSASASEVTAAALRDAHRAILVGQKSFGAVASSELLPLPGGAGMQVAVATASAADSTTPLDGVGVTPDVITTEARTLDDYRSGHDPQLDTAIAALANAPAPPALTLPQPAISPPDLDRLLAEALPGPTDVPTNDRLTSTNQWQRLDYIHPNEVIDQNGGAPDPVALQQALRSRGYQGTVMASYGRQPGDLPTVSINVDLYGSADGAHSSAGTNDLVNLQQPIDAPTQLGDETVAYRGTWLATGSTVLMWRRGRVVLTVTYSDVPGFDRPDTLATIAQLVDSRAQQLSIP